MKTVFYESRTSSPAFINPTDSVSPVEGFPEICISTFSRQIIDRIAALDHVEKIADMYTANGTNPVYKLTYRGREFALFLSLVGAPAAVCCLEEMIALGARKFVYFGCCGVLDDDKVNGRLIIPTAAIREEGTSYHYLPPGTEIAPDSCDTELLKSCMETSGYPHVCGKIWTTDAIYRETTDAIRSYRELGCVGTDMEYSALLAAARYRGVRFVQFLFGADSLSGEEWQQRDLTDYGLGSCDRYMALALECGLAM